MRRFFLGAMLVVCCGSLWGLAQEEQTPKPSTNEALPAKNGSAGASPSQALPSQLSPAQPVVHRPDLKLPADDKTTLPETSVTAQALPPEAHPWGRFPA